MKGDVVHSGPMYDIAKFTTHPQRVRFAVESMRSDVITRTDQRDPVLASVEATGTLHVDGLPWAEVSVQLTRTEIELFSRLMDSVGARLIGSIGKEGRDGDRTTTG